MTTAALKTESDALTSTRHPYGTEASIWEVWSCLWPSGRNVEDCQVHFLESIVAHSAAVVSRHVCSVLLVDLSFCSRRLIVFLMRCILERIHEME